jgi:uracil phosphoribosyltransferase
MAVKDFTNKKAVQLLATQSRRVDVDSLDLCKIHFEMGKLLAYEMLEEFELSETEIQHVQGIKKGMELANKNNIVIFALMRAGLYTAEGVRSVFKESQFIPLNEVETDKNDLENKIIIVVDAVINTGKSMVKVIEHLQRKKPKKIFIATLIIQNEALQLADKHENISFYALRISENKYVGKGGTDTGNRLFNTITAND